MRLRFLHFFLQTWDLGNFLCHGCIHWLPAEFPTHKLKKQSISIQRSSNVAKPGILEEIHHLHILLKIKRKKCKTATIITASKNLTKTDMSRGFIDCSKRLNTLVIKRKKIDEPDPHLKGLACSNLIHFIVTNTVLRILTVIDNIRI